jgi:hypothetical protein
MLQHSTIRGLLPTVAEFLQCVPRQQLPPRCDGLPWLCMSPTHLRRPCIITDGYPSAFYRRYALISRFRLALVVCKALGASYLHSRIPETSIIDPSWRYSGCASPWPRLCLGWSALVPLLPSPRGSLPSRRCLRSIINLYLTPVPARKRWVGPPAGLCNGSACCSLQRCTNGKRGHVPTRAARRAPAATGTAVCRTLAAASASTTTGTQQQPPP